MINKDVIIDRLLRQNEQQASQIQLLTEQKIRFVVLDRRVTQGTNSDAGMRFYERIWTVVARKQDEAVVQVKIISA